MPASKLSRAIIAETALEMLEAGEGLASLSMRKLGARLGVEAMSLYHYVENKADLLEAVLTLVLGRIELPTVDPDNWEEAVRAGLTSFRDVLESSRAALELISGQPPASRESFAVSYFGVSAFVSFGLTPTQAKFALHTALAFVLGHCAFKGSSLAGLDEDSDIDVSMVDDEEILGYIQRTRNTTRQEQFEQGLDVVIAGLRAHYGLA
jgi:TetR/AcrR family tetracycline transcriptional repressor